MIRTATEQDLDRIETICNQAIHDGFKTARLTPMGMEARYKWFHHYDRNTYPIFVFEENGIVMGWVSLSPYREGREALDETAVISYFVDFDCLGRGIGSQLINYVIHHLPDQIKAVFAIIIDGNEASIHLLKKFGFEQWGLLPGVYNAMGEVRDQVYYGKLFR